MALAGVERSSTSSAASTGIRSSAWRLTIRCMVHPSSKSSGLAHYSGGGRPSTPHRSVPSPELLLRDELPDEEAEQHEPRGLAPPPRDRQRLQKPPAAYVGSNPIKGRYVTDGNSNVTGVTGADRPLPPTSDDQRGISSHPPLPGSVFSRRRHRRRDRHRR